MDLLQRLEAFFRTRASGNGVVVAFSGGPDSTALLWGMSQLAPRLALPLFAAHLDHAMDAGSAARAMAAARLAARLGVPCIAARRNVLNAPGESRQAAARRGPHPFLRRAPPAPGPGAGGPRRSAPAAAAAAGVGGARGRGRGAWRSTGRASSVRRRAARPSPGPASAAAQARPIPPEPPPVASSGASLP